MEPAVVAAAAVAGATLGWTPMARAAVVAAPAAARLPQADRVARAVAAASASSCIRPRSRSRMYTCPRATAAMAAPVGPEGKARMAAPARRADSIRAAEYRDAAVTV